MIYQDFAPLDYDSGNYEPVLDKALDMIGYDASSPRSSRGCAPRARHVGIGVVCYVEGTGIGPFEGARVQVQASGKVSVVTGIGTQGQGHFTVFAQIAADQLGVEVDDVDVVTGDSDQFYWGAGTFASRGAVVAGNAIHAAAMAVRAKDPQARGRAFRMRRAGPGDRQRRGFGRRRSGNADDRNLAVRDLEVLLGAFEMLGGELENLLPHRLGRLVDGVARHHRAAAREGAGAPIELIGVAGDDVNVASPRRRAGRRRSAQSW